MLFDIAFPGMPSVGTYDQGTNGLTCLVDIADRVSSRYWTASQAPSGDRLLSQGACSITFTVVTPSAVTSDQTRYCVHGSLAATLLGAFDSSTIMLTASF
jgi:hypothetical protein